MKKHSFYILVLSLSAAIIGFALAKIDTSPGWDDTGIIVVMVIIASAVFSFIQPRFAWLWAILIAVPIPLLNILTSHNYGSLAAGVFSFIGAVGGFLLNRMVRGHE